MIPPASNFRLKNIEEYLIAEGYVMSGSSNTLHVYIDCIGGGHDISFNPTISPPVPNSSFLRDPPLRPVHDNYFTIHISKRYVETADDVQTAVKASRSNTRGPRHLFIKS